MRTDRGARAALPSALVLIGACAGGDIADPPRDGATNPPARVIVAAAERATVMRAVRLAASVEAYEQSPVYAKVPGYVDRIAVDIGDRVAQGQLLATLEVPEMAQQYRQAESRLAEQRAELAKADTEAALQRVVLERSRGLRSDDAITAQDLDDARARAAQAAATVRLAQARVASAEAHRAELQALMRYAQLRAPFAGVVTRRFVDRGALAQAATSSDDVSPLVIVTRTDRLRIVVDVPEPDVPFVDVGKPTVLEVTAIPDRRFSGEITRVARALAPESRTMRAEMDMPNPDGALQPGMYGTLTVELERHVDTLTVPESAVRREAGDTVVYVVDGDRAVRRPVDLGFAAQARVEIQGGLEEGQQVVVSGAAVADGAPIVIAGAGGAGG